MKVLVTGGYGFIGSHVAERFNREGYQVFILDNLSTGFESNIGFKHKFYKFDVQDKRCSEVFRNNKFDIVIHMAGKAGITASLEDPYGDSDANLLGLINMLRLSNIYGVKKFIYTSSAAVYGNNTDLPLREEFECAPTTPYGVNMFVEELYGKKWYEIYGLNTLCFRISNVYGPREAAAHSGSVVSSFVKNLLKQEELEVYGDGNQTRDFIYVEDVADAIFKSVDAFYSGVLNLSTKTETSINQLIDIIDGKYPVKGVLHSDGRKKDIYKSCLDNTRAKEELGWIPMYSLEEGIEKTIRWYIKNKERFADEVAVTEAVDKPVLYPKLQPYVVCILGFLAAAIFTGITLNDLDFKVFDFKLLYIIFIAVMYGTRLSAVSAGLSTILYIWTLLNMGRDLTSLIYSPDFLIQLSCYLLAGLTVGYVTDRRNREIQSKDMQLKGIIAKQEFINQLYNETRHVKEELQNQIANSEDSFGKIYSIIQEIDSLHPEDIFNASIGVLENVMKSNSISIYTVSKNSQYLRMTACSKEIENRIPKSLKVIDSPEIGNMMVEREVFINRKLEPYLPMLMAPIMDADRVIAILSIYDVKFENLTLYYQNLFSIVIGLISSSLSKAYLYEEATRSERFISDTRILNSKHFGKIVQSKRRGKKIVNSDYTILYLGRPDIDIQELSYILSNSVRESDYIGAGKSGSIYVLLSNTGESEADIVIERLRKMGITASIMSEENNDG